MLGRLGKHDPRIDPRTLKLGRYLSALPAPPVECDWLSAIKDWGEMGNRDYGDCVFAGAAHALQVWSAATGPINTISDEVVLSYYSKWAGFDPERRETDNGYVELDFLNHWRQEGFAGSELLAYADPAPSNIEHIKQSIYLFGGVYIGIALPITAQSQSVWSVVGNPEKDRDSKPYSWGGHAVFVPYYDKDGLVCITWGETLRMTWDFWAAYCDESHALLSRTWMERAPANFHLGDLEADLASVTN